MKKIDDIDSALTEKEKEMLLAAMIASPLMKPFPHKELADNILEVRVMSNMDMIHYWKTQLKASYV